MRLHFQKLFVSRALIAVLGLVMTAPISAQTFTTLHPFNGRTDGGLPEGGLVLSASTLYGTTTYGGSSDDGTVFKINVDGTGFKTLHVFAGSDGANPWDSLILSSNMLYGTTHNGGSNDSGAIFTINTDGTGFTNLYSFTAIPGSYPYTNSDGAWPYAGLLLQGNTLYGTASGGGASGQGTVFAINTDGTGFTNLYSFTSLSVPYSGTNGDGANPIGGLMLLGDELYGTTGDGGNSGSGTIFAINTNGTGFTNLYIFTATSASLPNTNSDGAYPQGGLVLAGGTLYGTTFGGGYSGRGTVFAVNTNGTGLTVLHSFTATYSPQFTNSDGSWPYDTLILSGSTLYGTASGGGGFEGTVFAVNTNGAGFTVVHNFTGGTDGDTPISRLVLSGNTLYGTAQYDGNPGPAGNGTVFSISFTPYLTIALSGTNVFLTWPTNVAGFDYTGYTLLSATNLDSPTPWATVSGLVVVNGQNVVTNPMSGAQMFYRLSQ